MSSYLVTGAAGFIGAKVAEFLLEEDHQVLGVDNLNDAYDVRLKHWRLERLRPNRHFGFQQLDISDREALSGWFRQQYGKGRQRIDAVINLAARAGVRQSVADPWVYLDTNVTGSLNLLELCREFDVSKYVLASTSSLYGASNPCPFREDANTDGPLSPYAASKRAAEGLCYTYHHLFGIDVSVLRYFTVYGPAGRPDMSLFRFVQWIHEGQPVTVYGDGTQQRDFTYVDDIARGTCAAIRPVGFEVINLGSDKPVVLNEAIQLVERLLASKAKIVNELVHPADVSATWAQIEKARRILGWQPQVSFEEGVGRLVSWYRENRDWAKDIVTR